MKVLLFSAHAVVWPQSFPEALIAEALVASGHEVLQVTCGGILKDFCISMSAMGLSEASAPEAKAEVCRQCRRIRTRIRTSFSFPGGDLEDYLTQEDRATVRGMLDAATPERVLESRIAGVEVGRYALYEFLLRRKKRDLSFSGQEWADLLIALGNAGLAVLAMQRLHQQERPDRIVVYNSLYSLNRSACMFMEAQGVPSYSLHAGGNLSNRLETMMVGRGSTLLFLRSLVGHWPRLRDLPTPEPLLAAVVDHQLQLFSGKSVFAYSSALSSQGIDIRRHFSIPEHQRILLATMSSLDERFAAETVGAIPPPLAGPFQDQIEWIGALIEHVRDRPDLCLIIRVHPREFPNKREGVMSEHARVLMPLLSSVPGNVRVNWPDADISLYDLAKYVDVVLNAWSSVGKEMALLGLPVVFHAPDLLFYPADLGYVGSTRAAYFDAIALALQEGWSAARMRAAYRWCALEFGRGLFDLSAGYRAPDRRRPFLRRVARRLLGTLAREPGQLLDCWLRPGRLPDAAHIAEVIAGGKDSRLDLGLPEAGTDLAAETQALRRQIARVLAAIFGESGDGAASPLHRHLTGFVQGAGSGLQAAACS